MEIIRLNLIPEGIQPIVHCKQYDNGRAIRVEIFNGKDAYILTNEVIELNVRKSDMHLVTIDLEVVEGRRYADIITTEQMCAVAGRNDCEIRVIKNGTDIGSLNFIMEVQKSPTEGGVQSDSEINNLRRQIEEIAEPVIEEVVPPIVERIVPEVIGDNYYNKEQTDALLEGKADVGASYTKAEEDVLLGNKADKSDTYTKAQVDSALSGKANVGASYTKSEEDALLANKANSADVYNKQTVDNKLAEKANTSNVNTALATKADKADTYTKSQVDSALSGKANVGVSYTKSEEDNLLSGKADKTDTYTKSEVDTALGNKADKSTTYTKQETDTLLSGKADKSNTYTKTQVDDIIYDTLPTDSVSKSAIATFETDLALPIKSLEVDVNAVQESGTPTPETPLPISGWSEISLVHCHKNLYQYDESKVKSGTTTTSTIRAFYPMGIKDVCTLTFSASLKSGASITQSDYLNIGILRKSDGLLEILRSYITPAGINVRTVDFSSGDEVILMSLENPTVIKSIMSRYDIQIEVGSSESTYEPYNGNLEVINLGGTYYGGHFTQDKAGHRQFEVTYKRELLKNWTWTRNSTEYAFAYFSTTNVTDKANNKNFVCEIFANKNNYRANLSDSEIGVYNNTTGLRRFCVRCDGATTPEEFNTIIGDYAIIYELATPIIIDLPDGEPIITLNGTNNIYADTGDTSVVFKNSVNGYVEKKIASVQALALNT